MLVLIGKKHNSSFHRLGIIMLSRHEEPTETNVKQNFKDRYHGINDPVAQKMLNRARHNLSPPEDKSIVNILHDYHPFLLFIINLDIVIHYRCRRRYFSRRFKVRSKI